MRSSTVCQPVQSVVACQLSPFAVALAFVNCFHQACNMYTQYYWMHESPTAATCVATHRNNKHEPNLGSASPYCRRCQCRWLPSLLRVENSFQYRPNTASSLSRRRLPSRSRNRRGRAPELLKAQDQPKM